MILLQPNQHEPAYPDERSGEIMRRTIAWFEQKGKKKLKADDHARVWYEDFLALVKEQRLFYELLTPAGLTDGETRWDTWRNCGFNEILGFYGLSYWYTWQVTMLGLGPIWMSDNAAVKERAVQHLREGGVFAFGLSEKTHGADVYSSEVALVPQEDGTYLARGSKYYIGNANAAAMVSVFGKLADTGDYVFFVVDPRHERFELVQNVIAGQSYVAEFRLDDYPITGADILSRGRDAWDAALNTVNVGKYNLGWGSIGIATHALYEAINHAAGRRLYGMTVTDFPHVRRMCIDAYARLVAMKLFALRASDYMRSASLDDRRYLLYNPMVKMKVTTEGERVIDLLWDIIAARGFEKDTYFEMAARDIRALPKLEGTVHVNLALILKFMPNYFFSAADCPEIPLRDDATNDDFLFAQGPTRGLGGVLFHDPDATFAASGLANVAVFREQVAVLKTLLMAETPDAAQQKDTDFLMELGQLFALVVYGQLILESAPLHGVGDDVVAQIFDALVRDVSGYALALHQRTSTTEGQAALCLQMIRRPAADPERTERVWQDHVLALAGAYEMSP
jgi:acyl-CoA dehydrogenase